MTIHQEEEEAILSFDVVEAVDHSAYHAHVSMNLPDLETAMHCVSAFYAGLGALMETIGHGAARESAGEAQARVEELATVMASGSTKAMGMFYQGLADKREGLASEN